MLDKVECLYVSLITFLTLQLLTKTNTMELRLTVTMDRTNIHCRSTSYVRWENKAPFNYLATFPPKVIKIG